MSKNKRKYDPVPFRTALQDLGIKQTAWARMTGRPERTVRGYALGEAAPSPEMRRLLRMLKLRPEMLNVLVLAGMEEDADVASD